MTCLKWSSTGLITVLRHGKALSLVLGVRESNATKMEDNCFELPIEHRIRITSHSQFLHFICHLRSVQCKRRVSGDFFRFLW